MLRPYQEAIVDETRELMRAGHKDILIVAPTGSGKTVLTAHMLKTAAQRGMDSIFVVHRRELIRQSIKTFHKFHLQHGVISPDYAEDFRHPVQIASIMSLARRLARVRKPTLVVWDESRHVAAKSWATVHSAFPGAFHIGLDGSPQRSDGRGLGKYFKKLVNGPSVSSLIEMGFLSRYRIFAPGNGMADKPTVTGDAVREYTARAAGKRALVFAASIQDSQYAVARFKEAGFKAMHLDGETDGAVRDQAVQDFEDGKIEILSNVGLFGEGYDLGALEVVIDLAPTTSLSAWLQRCGRALRTWPGKTEALILDHAGNCERHGLPDEPREWVLEGSGVAKRDADTGPSLRICKKCFAAQFPGSGTCQYCGNAFEIKARKIARTEGRLKEMTPEMILAAREKARERQSKAFEQSSARTYEQLVELGRQRKYVSPESWAHHILRSRRGRS